MLHNRLKGLLRMHGLVSATLVSSSIFVCAGLVKYASLELRPDVNLLPYAMGAGVAVLLSIRRIGAQGVPYHAYTWIDWARTTTKQVILVALLLFGLAFTLKDTTISQPFIFLFLAAVSVLLLVTNILLPRILMKLAFPHAYRTPTLFVGSRASIPRLQDWLHSREALGVTPVGFLRNDDLPTDLPTTGMASLGRISDLRSIISDHQVGQVILLDTPRDATAGRAIVDICGDLGCRLQVYNDLGDLLGQPVIPVTQGGQQYCVLGDEPLEDPVNRITKRIFDILIAAPLVAFVLPPLILLVWVMQRSQAPGPILFFQTRGSRNSRRFKMIKFRSMYVADKATANYAVQARKNDSRIYPFGAILRSTSLDEFPQFWNVLMGDMSIVGPRPHLPEHDEVFAGMTKNYRSRFSVKPGLTGLAQCRGFRGEITHPELIEQRLRHDLRYISHWSIWLDLQITLMTAVQMLFPPKSAR